METNKNSLQALLAYAQKQTTILVIVGMVAGGFPRTSYAASSWSPTLLVNTESFQQIDSGDSTTNVDLRFGSSASTLTLLTTGNFRFNKSLSVVGGLSGSYLTVDQQANISGSLTVKQNAAVRGNLSGSSFFGAGLGDCNNSTTSKLIYNSTTGKFSCATDQTGGSSGGGISFSDAQGIFVQKKGDTMTGALVIRPTTAQTDTGALNIVQQAHATGAYIKSTSNKEPALAIDIVGTSNAPHLLFGYQGIFDTNLYRAAANLLKTDDSFFAVGTISGSKLRVSGTADIHGALAASGSIRTDGNITINDDQSSDDGVLSFGNISGNQTLTFLVSTQKFQFSKKLSVIGNISGSTLRVDGNADVHGILSASGAVHFDANLSINDDQGAVDAVLTFGNATLNQDLKYLNTEQRFQFSTNLNVMGSISGKTLSVSGASSFSGASLFRTSVTTKGSFSGSSFFGAGLGDCNNSTTSKLIYNSTTGKFTCATDQTGGTSGGGGISFTDASGIFVNQSGDTMTGALNVRPSAGSATVGLNVAATMSGRNILISGTGGSKEPLIFGNTEQSTIGFGTRTPDKNGIASFSGAIAFQGGKSDPGAANTGGILVYGKNVSGRMMLKAKGPSGIDYPYQPSFFQNQICMLSAGAGTTINSVGCSATNDTTVSHPAVTETYGFMANFATAATALDNAGTSSNVVSFMRGSTAGANGFFYNARIGVVDNTDVRLFVGLANQTIAVTTDSDNFAGHYVGFQYSTARGDTTWQIVTKNNTTQTVEDTGVSVGTAKVYDMYLFCTPQCSSISWRLDNVTDATTTEGTVSATLPGSTTAMRGIVGVGAVAASAKNIRMQRMYIESDR